MWFYVAGALYRGTPYIEQNRTEARERRRASDPLTAGAVGPPIGSTRRNTASGTCLTAGVNTWIKDACSTMVGVIVLMFVDNILPKLIYHKGCRQEFVAPRNWILCILAITWADMSPQLRFVHVFINASNTCQRARSSLLAH